MFLRLLCRSKKEVQQTSAAWVGNLDTTEGDIESQDRHLGDFHATSREKEARVHRGKLTYFEKNGQR